MLNFWVDHIVSPNIMYNGLGQWAKRLTDLSVLGVSVDSKPSSCAFTMTLKLSLAIPER